jgi:hypothetical protein
MLQSQKITDERISTQGKRIKEWNEQQERHKTRRSGASSSGKHYL